MNISTESVYLTTTLANIVQPNLASSGVWAALANLSFAILAAFWPTLPCHFTLLRSGLESFSKSHP
jgi:hypothetical protein